MPQKTALITDKLAIGYRTKRRPDSVIAENLALHLYHGQLVCLLGANGCGKSTLMRTLAGMQPPLSGRVILSDDDLQALSIADRATRLSIVLTERPNLGLMNGYALVALGRHPHTDWMGNLSDHDKSVVQWAVDAVDARDIADAPVIELSDGQRQKLMIARALAQESDVILLDEPTAYLDLPRRVEMMRLLKHLAAETNRAILLSTHDLDLALRSADKLWLMSDGVIRMGTPEDLILSGAFEATFQSEGVTFDAHTGTFRIQDAAGKQIFVSGEDIPAIWTRRALERVGFQIVNNPEKSMIHITISNPDTTTVWELNHSQIQYHSIADLLWALDDTR